MASNLIHYLSTLILLISISLSKLPQLTNSEPPATEKTALQSFINQVPHVSRYNWNSTTSPCDWTGVTCDIGRSFVVTLRLPGAGLFGTIPSGTIGQLTRLRILSIHHNSLSGPLPSDLSNLTYLRSAYLNNNQFSSGFPSSFTALSRLSRLDLSSNQFTGPLPFSINNLRQLRRLYLQTNNFTGPLPSITIPLNDFNVSHNQLNGSIPKTLSNFPQSSFKGNPKLCGSPLSACSSSFFPSPPPSPPSSTTVPSSPAEQHTHKKLSTAAIIAISVSAAILLLILLICLLLCCLRRRRRNDSSKVPKSSTATTATTRAVGSAPGEAGTSSSKDDLTSGGGVDGERNKLVFINRGVSGAGGGYSFDLEDLLRASAEVLGKGSVGTSYKAVLEEGTTVVVKRLKDVVASKREFEMQMDSLGASTCRHQNVVPIRAYYFSKDEKLLVCDYYPAGSLSALLHGNRDSGRTAIDWESRMKVAICAARGLTHLHTTSKVVHGNIKSSNVLLHQGHQEAALNDFGLNPLFGSATPPNRAAGYRAPEVFESRKVTFKSDIYSFGVLLLELLTGKAPNQASLGDEGIDLPRWVQSVVREEWTAEVFDVELMRYNNIEEEMVQLLQLAMSCVQTVPDQRPTMPDVLRMMEEIPRGSGDTDEGLLRQSSDDPSKGSDGHTPPMSSVTP